MVNGVNASKTYLCRVSPARLYTRRPARAPEPSISWRRSGNSSSHERLGHILRMDDERLLKHAVRIQYIKGDTSNMLIDAPPIKTSEHLVVCLANDRTKWKPTWTRRVSLTLTAVSKLTITWDEDACTNSSRLTASNTPSPTPKPKQAKSAMVNYRARDKRMTFLGETEAPNQYSENGMGSLTLRTKSRNTYKQPSLPHEKLPDTNTDGMYTNPGTSGCGTSSLQQQVQQ